MKLTYKQVLADLKELAAERPDYVYRHPDGGLCAYFADGKPSCIVGHVLAKHGITVPDASNEIAWEVLANKLGLDIDEDAIRVLVHVQIWQDDGVPWGEAVEVAIEAIGKES